MKRLIFLVASALTASFASAQNCIVVNSEKVFKSLESYNLAIEALDKLAEQYQALVDDRFAEVETLYNNYMLQKASLSAATRQSRENEILTREQEAARFQESIFGQEGTMMERRVTLIEPIQKQVFGAIDAYAREVGAAVVIDSANNPTLLFTDPACERTQQIIDALKK